LAILVSADEVLKEVGLEVADSEARGVASTAEEAQIPVGEGVVVDAHMVEVVAVVEAAGLEEETTSDLAETIIEIKNPALPVLEITFLNVETVTTVADLVEANLFKRMVIM